MKDVIVHSFELEHLAKQLYSALTDQLRLIPVSLFFFFPRPFLRLVVVLVDVVVVVVVEVVVVLVELVVSGWDVVKSMSRN